MDALRWLGLPIGVLLFVGTTGSLLRTLVVPRGLNSHLASVVSGATRSLFVFIADRFRDYRRKDAVLAYLGPATIVALVFIWLLSYLVAFALALWAVGEVTVLGALRESGSAMLTLGFAQPSTPLATVVHVAAAATGLIAVALQIAYLPTLYGAFNRREKLLTTLESRAGVPPWGPEILARHKLVDLLDTMRRFYADWEAWAADVAETHANYPVLVAFRSPHPLRSWILALLAVLDSAALYHALSPSAAPSEARICLRMGFTALRDIAAAVGVPFDPDPMPTDPVALTFEEFATGVQRLQDVGFPMERTAEEAWPHFRGWRVNYESLAYAIADRVVAAPSLWSGRRRHVPDEVIRPLRPVDRRIDDEESLAQPKRADDWRT